MKYSKQTSKIGDPDGGNYQNVDSKGQTRLYGDATQWDDLKFPATTLRQGATTKPDFDPVDVGLLFPQNDSGEIVYIIAQMPHEWKLETDIHPHIHYVQDFDHTVTTPAFKMDYRWYKNGEDPTGSFTTITANTFVFPYTSGSILQIVSFPAIDATGIDAVSSMLDIKLYRDDNVVTGDILVKEFDIHYQKDAFGSDTEFVKYE